MKVAYVIPRGFNVGIFTLLLYHSEAVFPSSHGFLPERWLNDDGSRRKDLDQFLFSVGPLLVKSGRVPRADRVVYTSFPRAVAAVWA